jgi:6-phosphofructokinase 1
MTMAGMDSIGVFTSGGDAPGMNACVRAVVRSAIHFGIKVFGIYRGFAGMIDGEIKELSRRSVSGVIHQGGTVLKTSRSPEFMTPEGRKTAYDNLREHGIQGVVGCGGDGTFHGLHEMSREAEFSVIGLPGTIDNDIYGTDFTIGYDTAVNTAVEAIDKIRDTAQSHDRLFIIEVMGRHAGFIGLETGIGCGAEEICIPEFRTDLDRIAKHLQERHVMNKVSLIMVVAEGDDAGNATEIAEKLKSMVGISYRVTVLGHIQRGGSPTAKDRLLASKLGYYSVKALMEGRTGIMVGELHDTISETPLEDTWTKKKRIKHEILDMAGILSE